MFWKHYRSDIWQAGILHAPIAQCLSPASLAAVPITWLPPEPAFAFLADPVGLWHDGALHVFCEQYDYRTKHGVIRYFTYGADFVLRAQGLALRCPFHLSYPQVIAADGAIYMLPEAHASGRLTLYRAERFPDRWVPEADLLPLPAVDASVVRHQDRWWMFYSLPGAASFQELHVAFADRLQGPWHVHPGNPVRVDVTSGRPGGAPFVVDGTLYQPAQNCDGDYGRALTILRIDELSPTAFAAEPAVSLWPRDIASPMTDGLHTLSACGPVTLIDVKRIDRSPRRGWINLQRRLGRLRPAAG